MSRALSWLEVSAGTHQTLVRMRHLAHAPTTRFRFGILLLLVVSATPALHAQRITRRFESSASQKTQFRITLEGPAGSPSGDQIVTGWMGSVLLGFGAWRAFDEKNGHHSKVQNDWGYTPRAMTALAIGSFVGSTVGIWYAVVGSHC